MLAAPNFMSRMSTRSGITDMRLSRTEAASPGTYSAMSGASNSGASGPAISTTAMTPTRPKPRCSVATWNTPAGDSLGLATTYWPNPKLENWLADSTRTVATDTSPTMSGAMRWVRTSVPTTPSRRAPTLERMVQTAPRTALRARDMAVASGAGYGTKIESPASTTRFISGCSPDAMREYTMGIFLI